MLGKLIKYELRAMGRVLLPLFGALLLLSVVDTVALPDFTRTLLEMPSLIGRLTLMISRLLYFSVFFASGAVCVFISILRFKNNLLGNEGYLMNTLPVSPITNISAKIIVSTLYQLLGGLVAQISMVIIARPSIGYQLDRLFRIIADMDAADWFNLFYILVLAVGAVVLFNVAVYASLAVGHSFNSFKVIKSVGVFVALATVGFYVLGLLTSIERLITISWWQWYIMAIEFIYIAIGIFIANYFLKNRLNLE